MLGLTSLLSSFLYDFAVEFSSDYVMDKLNRKKETSITERELMSLIEQEINRQIQTEGNYYLQDEVYHLRSQQNYIISYFLKIVEDFSKTNVINNNNSTYSFVMPTSKVYELPSTSEAGSVDEYPINEIDVSLARIPVVLIFEGCSTSDTNCFNYNEILHYFSEYMKKCDFKYCADFIICSCSPAGPFLFQSLMPATYCKNLRLHSKINESDGASLVLSQKIFENAKSSIYSPEGIMIRPPKFIYVTKCSYFSSTHVSQAITSISGNCKQSGGDFAILNMDKQEYSGEYTDLLINHQISNDEQEIAYLMICYLCKICNKKSPPFNVVQKEVKRQNNSFGEISRRKRN